MCRLAINNDCMSEALVNLSTMVGFEGVPLHLTYFPKLWLDIHHAQVKTLECQYICENYEIQICKLQCEFELVLKVQKETS